MISHTVSIFSKMLVLFLLEFNSWIIIFSGNSQIDLRFDAVIAFFHRVLNRKRWEKIRLMQLWLKAGNFHLLAILTLSTETFWNDIDIVIKNMTIKSRKIFLIWYTGVEKTEFSLYWKIFREINLHYDFTVWKSTIKRNHAKRFSVKSTL